MGDNMLATHPQPLSLASEEHTPSFPKGGLLLQSIYYAPLPPNANAIYLSVEWDWPGPSQREVLLGKMLPA